MVNKYIEEGYNKTLVLKIVGLQRSTYYYNISNTKTIKTKPKGGKPKGYCIDKNNNKICDEKTKELILQAIE